MSETEVEQLSAEKLVPPSTIGDDVGGGWKRLKPDLIIRAAVREKLLQLEPQVADLITG